MGVPAEKRGKANPTRERASAIALRDEGEHVPAGMILGDEEHRGFDQAKSAAPFAQSFGAEKIGVAYALAVGVKRVVPVHGFGQINAKPVNVAFLQKGGSAAD